MDFFSKKKNKKKKRLKKWWKTELQTVYCHRKLTSKQTVLTNRISFIFFIYTKNWAKGLDLRSSNVMKKPNFFFTDLLSYPNASAERERVWEMKEILNS